MGSLWREMPISRAFLYISFRAPNKGALPPRSPRTAPTERDAPLPELHFICFSESPAWPQWRCLFQSLLLHISWSTPPPKKSSPGKIKSHLSLKVPGKETPSMIAHQGAHGERCSVFRANGLFIYISQSTHWRSSPKKQSGDIWSPPTERTKGVHTRCCLVPKGIVYNNAITTPVPCSLQHNTFHLGLGRPKPC